MSRKLSWSACSFVFALAPLVAQQQPDPGKQVFDARCSVCHGSDGNGGEFAAAIVVRLTNRTDSDLAAIIINGLPNRGMPAFELDEKDRANLIAYMRTLKPPRKGVIAQTEVDVPLMDGKALHGLALNRSAIDMQLRTADGKVVLLRKDGNKYRRVTSQGDWPSYDGQTHGNRFSNMRQINRTNASRMMAKWIFTLPNTIPLEGTPIVVDGLMYVTAGNECYALDAGSGREVWHYERRHTKGLESKVNRGVAVSGDRVFMVTDNAHLIALNRFTGALLWDTEMADYKQNYFATSAPLVAGSLVVAGIGGGDTGVRGFLSAYDSATGKEAWRFWTIPAAGEPGSETWKGKDFNHPGGSTWFTGSYDEDSRILYWQVGNPGPDHNGDNREGDNLYTDSVIALDPATGKLKWHYQFTPHDEWDWDADEPLVLVDANWEGTPRKLLLQANRNGFFYVLDRIEGTLLLGKPFAKKVTWASAIGKDGRPIRNPNQVPTERGTKICPAVLGATNWWSAAYDASAGLFYIQAIESCGIYTKGGGEWGEGRPFMGGHSRTAPSDPLRQYLRAIDIRTGKVAWEMPEVGSGESRSGTLATAGGVVFLGEDTGALMAVDSSNGKPLWQFQTSQPLRASPMTYMFDDHQYVAIASGSSILAFGLME